MCARWPVEAASPRSAIDDAGAANVVDGHVAPESLPGGFRGDRVDRPGGSPQHAEDREQRAPVRVIDTSLSSLTRPPSMQQMRGRQIVNAEGLGPSYAGTPPWIRARSDRPGEARGVGLGLACSLSRRGDLLTVPARGSPSAFPRPAVLRIATPDRCRKLALDARDRPCSATSLFLRAPSAGAQLMAPRLFMSTSCVVLRPACSGWPCPPAKVSASLARLVAGCAPYRRRDGS